LDGWNQIVGDSRRGLLRKVAGIAAHVAGAASVGGIAGGSVASWKADEALRLERSSGLPLQGELVLNVLDFGAVGDGIADDAAAINAAIGALPEGVVERVHNEKVIGGGGVVLLPPLNRSGASAVYRTTASILWVPNLRLVGSGSVIDYSGRDAAIMRKSPYVPYDGNGGSIEGLIVRSSSGAGRCGIEMTRWVEGEMRNVLVYGFNGDGIRLSQCQWLDIHGVQSVENGGYGFSLGASAVPGELSGYRTNNCTFTRCKGEANGLGGALVVEGHQNSFLGSTFQFSSNGYGVHVRGGDALSTTAVGCHFEGNAVHVFAEAGSATVQDALPRGTSIVAPFFVTSPECRRFMQNQGLGTVVVGGCSQNDSSVTPATLGTKAPFEQHSISGDMSIVSFPAISGIPRLLCDERGLERVVRGGGSVLSGDVTLGDSLSMANVGSAVPSEIVGAGGALYVEAGALKYRGGNGTVTVLGPA
jgi:hypothetical protein